VVLVVLTPMVGLKLELAIQVAPVVAVVGTQLMLQLVLVGLVSHRRTFKVLMGDQPSPQVNQVVAVVLERRVAHHSQVTRVAMGVCLLLLVHKRITAVAVTAQTLCPTHLTQVSIFAIQHQDEAVVERLAATTRPSNLACLVTQIQVAVVVERVATRRRQPLGMAGPAVPALSLSVGKRFRRSHGAFRIA
jgi:hypothetical protein